MFLKNYLYNLIYIQPIVLIKIQEILLKDTIYNIVKEDIIEELVKENKELKSKSIDSTSYNIDTDNTETDKSLDDLPKLRGKNYFF